MSFPPPQYSNRNGERIFVCVTYGAIYMQSRSFEKKALFAFLFQLIAFDIVNSIFWRTNLRVSGGEG
jgi:hypothetical protein